VHCVASFRLQKIPSTGDINQLHGVWHGASEGLPTLPPVDTDGGDKQYET
jgi:hypothetical protein